MMPKDQTHRDLKAMIGSEGYISIIFGWRRNKAFVIVRELFPFKKKCDFGHYRWREQVA